MRSAFPALWQVFDPKSLLAASGLHTIVVRIPPATGGAGGRRHHAAGREKRARRLGRRGRGQVDRHQMDTSRALPRRGISEQDVQAIHRVWTPSANRELYERELKRLLGSTATVAYTYVCRTASQFLSNLNGKAEEGNAVPSLPLLSFTMFCVWSGRGGT